ncbi:two component transcriptional regulator, AraC family [Litchfieldia salsa]|uniref:Two component transcriptional regulator, AraC family n=1 Tax=Litchfieldia salsa TaxID=930152 RepID=A0A1H0W2P8_9BACI|nr:two component transcriptional regulator, AraC family [Litchfieldia salsa]
MIADDEPNIREGIRDSINWNEVGMEVVAEAEDGEEALELALKHEIDILLVDLNMPIMNGLTMVKHLRQDLPGCRVLVISGYDQFSYAQEALRLQVEDYLLKPVKPEKLLEVLHNIRDKINQQAEKTNYMKMATSHITQHQLVIQERFCRDWVEGHLSETKTLEQLRFLEMPTTAPTHIIVIRSQEFQFDQPLIRGNDREIFIFAVKNILLEIVNEKKSLIFTDSKGLFFIILWGQVQEDLFSKIENAIQEYLKAAATVYAEPITGDLMDVPTFYKNCKSKVYGESIVSPIVKRARNYIREHYTSTDLTLDSLAQSLQVSPVYLSRTIKQELGLSFVSLITQMRMKKAISLLNSTDLQIHEIAEQVGYDSQHYFSTAFKKAVGVSPNKYRKGIYNEDKPVMD